MESHHWLHGAGPGRETPYLVVVTEATWREMAGRLPTEDAG